MDHAEFGDTVVVWSIDRLGHALIDVLNTVNMMRGASIVVRSISDRIDPATSTGRLMLNILAALAGYEGELIVERVNAGIAAARQSGTRFGRPLSGPTFTCRRLSWLVRLERRARPQPWLRPWSAGVEHRLPATSKAQRTRTVRVSRSRHLREFFLRVGHMRHLRQSGGSEGSNRGGVPVDRS